MITLFFAKEKQTKNLQPSNNNNFQINLKEKNTCISSVFDEEIHTVSENESGLQYE